MIKWLGRATLVDICINGTLGWQDKVFGGDDKQSCIFRSTMIHNRKNCVALYVEEYEQLVLECYWTAHAKVKMANNRCPPPLHLDGGATSTECIDAVLQQRLLRCTNYTS